MKKLIFTAILLVATPAFSCIMTQEDIFKSEDTNGDGIITLDEYISDVDDTEKAKKLLNTELFNGADANHNGKIEWSERSGLPPRSVRDAHKR